MIKPNSTNKESLMLESNYSSANSQILERVKAGQIPRKSGR